MVQALVRDKNWQRLLSLYMQEANLKPGEWGTFDCALNCADAILAITHTDIAPQIRGKYHTEEEANALLQELGFANTLEYAASYMPTDKPFNGFSGDLGAFHFEGHDIIGVIYKGRIFSPAFGRFGMWSAPITKAHTVFKVGTP